MSSRRRRLGELTLDDVISILAPRTFAPRSTASRTKDSTSAHPRVNAPRGLGSSKETTDSVKATQVDGATTIGAGSNSGVTPLQSAPFAKANISRVALFKAKPLERSANCLESSFAKNVSLTPIDEESNESTGYTIRNCLVTTKDSEVSRISDLEMPTVSDHCTIESSKNFDQTGDQSYQDAWTKDNKSRKPLTSGQSAQPSPTNSDVSAQVAKSNSDQNALTSSAELEKTLEEREEQINSLMRKLDDKDQMIEDLREKIDKIQSIIIIIQLEREKESSNLKTF